MCLSKNVDSGFRWCGMTTKRKPRYTAAELANRIHGFIEQLAEETDEARLSDEFQRYLEFSSMFHKYSWRNQMLIWMLRTLQDIGSGRSLGGMC